MSQDTMDQAPKMSSKTEKQFREELEALNKESNLLNEHRVRIQAEVERARKEKKELEASFIAEFGTSDISALTVILADRERFNEEALAAYRAGLSELKAEINEVNQKLASIK